MPAADRSLMTDIFMTRMFGFIFEQNSDNEKYRSEDAKELRETCVGIGRELDRTYIKLLGVNILASETRNKIDRGLVTLKENEKNAGQRYDGLFARLQDVENRVETNSRWMRAEISARIDVYSTPIIRRLDRAESISRNRLCTQGWQKIHRVYTWASDYLPPCFPLTIKDFRTLKEPDQCRSSPSVYSNGSTKPIASNSLEPCASSSHLWCDRVWLGRRR